MDIKVNKEIRDYQESVFMGLSLRQSVFSLLAVGAAVAIYFLLKDIVGQETVSWLCVLGALPFALFGFVKYHGMYLEALVKAYVISEWLTPRDLPSVPGNLYAEALKETKYKEVLRHD